MGVGSKAVDVATEKREAAAEEGEQADLAAALAKAAAAKTAAAVRLAETI